MAENSTVPGRYDFILFSSGGWECIGKQPAFPPIDESLYRPKVAEYAAKHPVTEATKMTLYYSMVEGACQISIMPYAEAGNEVSA